MAELIEDVKEIKHDITNEKILTKELKKSQEKHFNNKITKSEEAQKNIKSNKIDENND